MTFNEIQQIIALIKEHELSEFKLEDKDFKITIRSDKGTVVNSAPQVVSIPTHSPQVVESAPVAVQPVAAAAPVAVPEVDENAGLVEIKSPMVGTFYRAASPEKPPYVKVGDNVSTDSVVCVIEAMKLFNEIESEVSGKIVKILIEDASPVEYDQPIFLVDPQG